MDTTAQHTSAFFAKALLAAVALILMLSYSLPFPADADDVASSIATSAAVPPAKAAANVSEDRKQRGLKMRAAIEKKYMELKERDELTVNGTIPFTSIPDNGITAVVLEYIPVGTSFDEAEQVLRGAGFTVSSHPRSDTPGTRPDRYDVVASLTSPSLQEWLSRTDIDVDLIPRAPGDYSNVHRLSASITVTYP